MNINRVTFTGVDDSTNIKDLEVISAEFPFVEFGILYSDAQSGKGGKYPSKVNILRLLINNPFEESNFAFGFFDLNKVRQYLEQIKKYT